MQNFFIITCLLCVFWGQQTRAVEERASKAAVDNARLLARSLHSGMSSGKDKGVVDFRTHYLARTQEPSPEFSLLLHLFQTQLDTTLAASHYYRFVLHSLLAIPPQPLPAMLKLPPLTLPADEWAERARLPRAVLLQGDDVTHTSLHQQVRAVLQVLWGNSVRLAQLQALAQRMPQAQQYDVAHQQQASSVLRTLVLDIGELEELEAVDNSRLLARSLRSGMKSGADLSNAERGLLEELVRAEQRQRRVRQALIGGGALAAAVLLGRGVWRLRGVDWRALWSKRVLGMHLGYSMTTLAALYPAWQLGKTLKQHAQRIWQTPADLRQHSDYRIAYLAFLSNPHNLQRQQEMLHTLNRCLQHLSPLFAEREISIKVNTQHNRYHIVRAAAHVSIAVPYSASNDVSLALEQAIAHYYEGKWPPNVLSQDIKYCRRDRA